jgi:hypothetical protein
MVPLRVDKVANPGPQALRPRAADIEADRSGGNVTLMQFVRMLSPGSGNRKGDISPFRRPLHTISYIVAA